MGNVDAGVCFSLKVVLIGFLELGLSSARHEECSSSPFFAVKERYTNPCIICMQGICRRGNKNRFFFFFGKKNKNSLEIH